MREKPKKNSAEVQYRMANLWQYKGRIDQAIKGYRETLRIEPTFVPAQLELGNLLVKQGEVDAAILLYQEAMVINPQNPVFPKKFQALVNKQRASLDGLHGNVKPEGRVGNRSTSTKRILLYSDCSGMYGAGHCNHILIRELAKMGFCCTFVQPMASHHLVAERQSLGIEQLWIEHDDIYSTRGNHPSLWKCSEPERIFVSTRPDLIIFGDGCPVSNLAAKQVASRQGIPYLIIVHCVTQNWSKQFSEYLEILRDVFQKATRVIAVSEDNLSLLHRLFQLPVYQGEVIYNGVPERFFSPVDVSMRERIRGEIGVPHSGILCLTVGRMEMVKGYQYQMKAIEQLRGCQVWPNLYFAWAGTGTLEPRLRAWASKLEVEDHIKFLGERADISDLLNAADMFLLPSQFEGMPLSIAEAMAKGLPVAASGVSGVPEELGNTGNLLPDPLRDLQELISQLARVIQLWAENPTIRRQVGRQCQRRANDMFKVNQSLSTYLRHIEQVLGERKSLQKSQSLIGVDSGIF